jgi:hypothetical protein
VNELHAQRQGDAQNLFVLTLRLDEDRGGYRLPGLDAGVFTGEAYLLSIGIRRLARLPFEAELGPGRENELHRLLAVLRLLALLARLTRLGLGRLLFRWRRRLLRFWSRFGGGFGRFLGRLGLCSVRLSSIGLLGECLRSNRKANRDHQRYA